MRRTLLLTLLLVCLGGCTAIRNDRTEFEEAPEPTGTAAVSIGRRHSVVIEQVGGTWNGTPYRADLETRQRFAETLRKSLVFDRVYLTDEPDSARTGIAPVEIDASYDSDPFAVSNFFRALLVGTIGYRVAVEGRLTVTIRLTPDREPIVHQVTSRARRIYYSSGRAGVAQAFLVREVEQANRERIRDELRSDPRLIETPR